MLNSASIMNYIANVNLHALAIVYTCLLVRIKVSDETVLHNALLKTVLYTD